MMTEDDRTKIIVTVAQWSFFIVDFCNTVLLSISAGFVSNTWFSNDSFLFFFLPLLIRKVFFPVNSDFWFPQTLFGSKFTRHFVTPCEFGNDLILRYFHHFDIQWNLLLWLCGVCIIRGFSPIISYWLRILSSLVLWRFWTLSIFFSVFLQGTIVEAGIRAFGQTLNRK